MRGPTTDFQMCESVAPAGALTLDTWRDIGLQRVEPAGDLADIGMFRSRVLRLASEAGAFADVSMTPITVRRQPSLCRRDGGDEIFVSLELGGEVLTQVGTSETETKVRPGAIQIMDFGQPLLARWEATIHRGLHVYLPRAIVDAALKPLRPLNGRILSPKGLAPLLASQMRTLAETAAGLGPVERAIALQGTVDLALTVLRLDIRNERIEF